MASAPKMKWTFMSLQIQDEIRQGRMTFEEMFPRAREAGFVAYDASDGDAEFASREEVLRLCAGAGLQIADYIHWVHMAAPTKQGVLEAVESGCQAVRTALEHGTNRLMIVERVSAADLARMTREEAASCLADALDQIARYARAQGVTAMVEDYPDPRLPMCSTGEMLRLMKAAPDLRLVLDTGNMLAQKEDPVAFYEELKGYVAHVHLKDIEYPASDAPGDIDCDGRRIRNAQHGEGVVDFAALLPRLQRDGYDGYVTVEYGPHEGTKDHFEKMAESIRYLEGLLK